MTTPAAFRVSVGTPPSCRHPATVRVPLRPLLKSGGLWREERLGALHSMPLTWTGAAYAVWGAYHNDLGNVPP